VINAMDYQRHAVIKQVIKVIKQGSRLGDIELFSILNALDFDVLADLAAVYEIVEECMEEQDKEKGEAKEKQAKKEKAEAIDHQANFHVFMNKARKDAQHIQHLNGNQICVSSSSTDKLPENSEIDAVIKWVSQQEITVRNAKMNVIEQYYRLGERWETLYQLFKNKVKVL
jgi:hypothetical protein